MNTKTQIEIMRLRNKRQRKKKSLKTAINYIRTNYSDVIIIGLCVAIICLYNTLFQMGFEF